MLAWCCGIRETEGVQREFSPTTATRTRLEAENRWRTARTADSSTPQVSSVGRPVALRYQDGGDLQRRAALDGLWQSYRSLETTG
jgi:hypothetical protein